MIGTLINALGVVVGGLVGLLLKKILPLRLKEPLMRVMGVGTFAIGLFGMAGVMLSVENGKIASSGELLLLVSLVIGCVAGELLKIDDGLNRAAAAVEKLIGKPGFSAGFVPATLIFCIGAMTIMGPINEMLTGDIQLLLIKSLLDFITSVLLAATVGYGVVFAAVPVLVVQGGFALCATLLAAVPQTVLDPVFAVGYALVMCIGINFIFGDRIKTANVLPALLVPILYNLLLMLK